MACNATLEGMGHLNGWCYVLHDRDSHFCAALRGTLAAGGVKCLRLPPRSRNLNTFASAECDRLKKRCLSRLILLRARSLRKAPPSFQSIITQNATTCRSSLFLLRLSPVGDVASAVENALGLLKYYSRAA